MKSDILHGIEEPNESEINTLWDRRRVEILTRWFPKNAKKIVDAGCGHGRFLIPLKEIGFKPIGLDISKNATSFCKKRGIEAHVCDLEKQKFPIKGVDVIMSFGVIEHFQSPNSFLKECQKALKKGGILITITPDFQRKFKSFYDCPGHINPYTKQKLRQLLEAFGFEIVEIRNFGKPDWLKYAWKWFDWPLLRGGDAIAIARK